MQLREKDYHLVLVNVWWLEMHTTPEFSLPHKSEVKFILLQRPIDTDLYRQYYKAVGYRYNWLDRLVIPDELLSSWINAGNVEIYVLKINGKDAGYAEFAKEKEYTEIVYFGLMQDFIGKGYGKFFLQWVINKAWSYHPRWIQLNTCSLDHHNALGIYQSAGFKIVKTTSEQRKVLNSQT